MTKFYISTPAEVDINIDEHLPQASTKALLKDIERHFNDHIHIDKPRFIRLVNYIVEMRFDNAFAILDDVSNGMVTLEDCQRRHTKHLHSPYRPSGEAATTPAINPTKEVG